MQNLTSEEIAGYEEFVSHFQVKKQSGEELICTCPVCGKDKLYITCSAVRTKPDTHMMLLDCKHGCKYKEILSSAGLEPKELYLTAYAKQKSWKSCADVRTHVYRNADGSIFARKDVYKFHSPCISESRTFYIGDKQALWYLYDNEMQEYNQKAGLNKQKAPLYHIERLKDAKTVYIPEGEKDVETLEKLGYTACAGGGGASENWKNTAYLEQLRSIGEVSVILLCDNDEAGRERGVKVGNYLAESGISCRVINCTDIYSESKAKWDITDIYEKLGAEKTKELLDSAVARSEEVVFQPELTASSKKMYRFDDSGNAERLADNYRDDLKWSYVDKRWLYYLDGKWNYDDVGYHRKIADIVTDMLEQEFPLYQGDDEMEKAFMKHLKKSRSYTGKTNMMKEYEHYAPILPRMLDRHKMLLNCKNGIVDLTTGELKPHDKKAYLTKQIPVNYIPEAPEPELWLKFLDDIFLGDKYMIHYIQKCCGYSLSGSIEEQCLFFLLGSGGNGKSVFLEIIRYIFGDYATNIQPQTIMMSQKSGNGPSGDIARLKGARLVTSVEPNEGALLDEGLVKQLTGGDVVTARKMFGDDFEFKPEFKLWVATNHKPKIRGTDNGIWRRIHLIPFKLQLPPDKIDKHLKYRLVREAESILKWIIEGFRLWKAEGLTMPKAVLEATEEYRNEMDTLGAFIEACCTVGNGDVKASQLYAVYAKWADDNNEYKLSNTKFGNEMVKRFQKVRTKSGLYYKGITVGIS